MGEASQEMFNTISRWLNRKTKYEIKQAIAAIQVIADEHRAAGREEQALMAEAHLPLMRNYLHNVLPKRMEKAWGSDYTVQ